MGAQAFESIVGRIDYPMYIVTALVGEERDGCLVGFTTQCSIEPPRFAAFLSKGLDPTTAASAAAVAHGLAAAASMHRAGLVASDLLALLPAALGG